MEKYQYRAFISYRHVHPDMDIAKKLHGLIENFRIPASIQKAAGIQKMGRVFRDQEELPLSSDLGKDIECALENSEWLIVICSPRLQESKWCMREIDKFIELGKRDHILTVLVDGEPGDSFPQQLCTIEKDGKIEQIEPLAADCRGKNLLSSFHKLKREKLRLIAPMLRLNYDDLQQRAKARKQRITLGATAAALTLVTAFGIYAAIQNARIKAERDAALNNEMRMLIEKSNLESSNGSKLHAQTYLLQAAALREQVGERNDTEMKNAMEYALYSGMFEPVLTVDTANRRFSSLTFSEDDTMLLGITNVNSASLIDLDTGTIRYTVSRAMSGELDSVGFLDGDEYIYLVDSWYGYVSVYHSSDGSLAAEYSIGNDPAWQIGEKVFPLGDHKLLIVLDNKLLCWDYLRDEKTYYLEDHPDLSLLQPLKVEVFHDRNRVAIGSDGWSGGFIFDRSSGSILPLDTETGHGYSELAISRDDSYLLAKSGNTISVFDAGTGERVLTYGDNGERVLYGFRFMNTADRMIIADSLGFHCISVPDGRLLWESGEDAPDLQNLEYIDLSPDDQYLCYHAADSGVIDTATGEIISNAKGQLFSHDGRMLLLNTDSGNTQIAATDLTSSVQRVSSYDGTLYKTERYSQPKENRTFLLTHPVSSVYTEGINAAMRQRRVFNDENQKYSACALEDGFVEIFSYALEQDTAFAAYGEHCYNAVTDMVFHEDMLASAGGYDHSAVLFDCGSGTISHVLRCEGYAGGVEFSPDGSKLMVISLGISGEGNFAYIYSVDTGALLFRMEAGNAGIEQFGFSADGTSAVMILDSGSAVIGSLYGSLESMIEMIEQ